MCYAGGMRRRRFTPEQAAREIKDARDQGYQHGITSPLDGWLTHRFANPYRDSLGLRPWEATLYNTWMDGFKQGREQRRRDLSTACHELQAPDPPDEPPAVVFSPEIQ